jgi:hypothetical protein
LPLLPVSAGGVDARTAAPELAREGLAHEQRGRLRLGNDRVPRLSAAARNRWDDYYRRGAEGTLFFVPKRTRGEWMRLRK